MNIQYESYYGTAMLGGNYLEHHGVKGMRWGVRRYQNKDGTLTPKGQKRYQTNIDKLGKYSEDPRYTLRAETYFSKVTSPVQKDLERNDDYRELKKYKNERDYLSPKANVYANKQATKQHGTFVNALATGKAGEYLETGRKAYDDYIRKHGKVLTSKTPDQWAEYSKEAIGRIRTSVNELSKKRLGDLGNQPSPRPTAVTYDTKTKKIRKTTYNELMETYIDLLLQQKLG